MKDLENMTPEELETLKKDVDKAMILAEKKKRAEALEAARATAKDHGYALEDLIEGAGNTKRKVAPKYKDPKDPTNLWTGRGRRPLWVQAALDEGKTLEDLAI